MGTNARRKVSNQHMPRFIQRVTLATFLIATANLFWPIVPATLENLKESIIIETADDHFTLTEACTFGPPINVTLRIWIVLLLVVAVIGSRIKGLPNTFLTIVGLMGATFICLSWWRVVFRVSANADVPLSSLQHVAYLYGANVVDLLVAGLIACLISLNLRHAVQVFFAPTPST